MAERVDESLAEQGVDRRCVFDICVAIGDHGQNPAGSGQPGATSAIALNRRPIWSGAVSRARAAAISGPRSGAALASEAARSLIPIALSQAPCGDGPKMRTPRGAGGRRQRVEIDMGGEIALAGRLERIGIGMAGDGLQRVAGAGPIMTVIEDQRRAALRGETAREIARRSQAQTGESSVSTDPSRTKRPS